MIRTYKTKAAFGKIIGVQPSAITLWLSGKTKPGPFAFQNILEVLKLKAYDLEDIERKEIERKAPKWVNESDEQYSIQPSEQTEKPSDSKDDIETKVIKILRLQKELPELVDRMEKLQSEIKELKNKLSELM